MSLDLTLDILTLSTTVQRKQRFPSQVILYNKFPKELIKSRTLLSGSSRKT